MASSSRLRNLRREFMENRTKVNNSLSRKHGLIKWITELGRNKSSRHSRAILCMRRRVKKSWRKLGRKPAWMRKQINYETKRRCEDFQQILVWFIRVFVELNIPNAINLFLDDEWVAWLIHGWDKVDEAAACRGLAKVMYGDLTTETAIRSRRRCNQSRHAINRNALCYANLHPRSWMYTLHAYIAVGDDEERRWKRNQWRMGWLGVWNDSWGWICLKLRRCFKFNNNSSNAKS